MIKLYPDNKERILFYRALSEAEQWYKQNQQLKRLSMAGGAQAVLADVVDSGEDLEALKKSVKDLSASNAKLQTELNEAKLTEFEATEQVINLTQVSESFLPETSQNSQPALVLIL